MERQKLEHRMKCLFALMGDPYKAPEVRTGAAVLMLTTLARWFCTFERTEPDTASVEDMIHGQ